MKNRNKFFALLLIVALMLCLVAGCGSQTTTTEEETETTSSETTQEAEASEETTTEAATAPAEEEPAASEDVAVPEEATPEVEETEEEETTQELAQVEYDLLLFTETAQVSIWYPLRQDNVQAPEKASGGHYFWAQLQDDLNIDIEFVEPGQATATEKYNLLVASGDMTDLILETFCLSGDGGAYLGGYDKAIEDNVYLDLSELVEENCPNYWYWINQSEDNIRNAYTDTGKIGAFLTINGEESLSNQGLGVNQDLFEATGLDMPETISDWTEMFAALKANGVAYPCAINSELSILEGAAAAMGASVDTTFIINTDGELVFGPTTDETRAYIELLADYYSKGYIDPDFIGDASVMNNTNFNTGLTFTTRLLQQELSQYYDTYGVNVIAAPTVRAEDAPESGMQLLVTSQSLVSASGMAVSTNCTDNLETALLLMDWFYSPYGSTMANYGLLDVTYEINEDGEPQINDFYQERTNGVFNRGIYTVSGDFGLVWPNCSLTTAGDAEQEAMAGWTTHDWDGAIYHTLPSIALTAEESNSVSSHMSDMETIVDTHFMSWVVGAEELNDETWDAFLTALEQQGLQACQEAYTAAYQRYLEK